MGTIYKKGSTGFAIDQVGKYLEATIDGYTYNGKYDKAFQNALAQGKVNLGIRNTTTGGNTFKGGTFGNATLRAIENYNKMQSDNAYAKQLEALVKQQEDQAYNNMIYSAQSAYQQADDSYKRALAEANQQIKQDINANYDDSARDYYTLYKRQTQELPERLSMIGSTGGMSETAQLGLMNKYSDNLRRNEQYRNGKLYDAEADYQNRIAQNSQRTGERLAEMYYENARDQLNYKRQQEQEMYERQRAEEQDAYNRVMQQQALAFKQGELAKKQRVANRNNKVYANIAKRKSEGYKVVQWKDGGTGELHYRLAGMTKSGSRGGSRSGSRGGSRAKSGSIGKTQGYSFPTVNNKITSTTKKKYSTNYNSVKSTVTNGYKNIKANPEKRAKLIVNYIKNSGLSKKQSKKLLKEVGLL